MILELGSSLYIFHIDKNLHGELVQKLHGGLALGYLEDEWYTLSSPENTDYCLFEWLISSPSYLMQNPLSSILSPSLQTSPLYEPWQMYLFYSFLLPCRSQLTSVRSVQFHRAPHLEGLYAWFNALLSLT